MSDKNTQNENRRNKTAQINTSPSKANQRWCLAVLGLSFLLLFGLGMVTVVIDPYFHYHKP
ncbi:MAG: hypothetical protein NC413_11390, partial [Muribaculum sp.]|nr:hypothetical protein [Muribaculum sp.]